MPHIFEYTDYLSFFQDLVKSRESRGQTRTALAKVIGCQAAYLSQVLKGKADITEDHAIKLCEYLLFSPNETEYFLTLLRLVKAGTEQLKKHLNSRQQELRKTNDKVENRISSKMIAAEELTNYYCSSWLPSLLHVATSCNHLQTDKALAERFSLDPELVRLHLTRLEGYSLVKFENNRWHYLGGSMHFGKDSPSDLQFQTARRLLALNSLSKRKDDGEVHYSVIFATDKKTYLQLQSEFLKHIEQLHKMVEPTKSEDVYTVCIDLFRT